MDPAGLRRGMRLTSQTLVAKWAETVSQALLVLILPRALGPSAYGEFAVAFAAVSLLSLGLGLGAPLAAIRYVPAATAGERLGLARTVARSVAISRARILAALTAAAVALAPPVLGVPLLLTLVVCAAAWCSVGSSIASELALAAGRSGVWNIRFPLENALVVVAASAGYATAGAHGAITGMALACAATFAVLFTRLATHLRGARGGPRLPAGAVAYVRLETVSVVLGTIVMRGGPLARPLAGASTAQTGFAAIATGVGAAGMATMVDLLIVHLPRLVQLRIESGDHADHEAARAARHALLVAIATALPMALLAGPAVHVAFGADFSGARSAVELALPSIPLGVVLGLATVTASLDLRPGALAVSWGIGAVTFAGVAAATIPGLDAEGAALAMSGGFLASALAATALIGGRELRRACVAALAVAAAVLVAGALTA